MCNINKSAVLLGDNLISLITPEMPRPFLNRLLDLRKTLFIRSRRQHPDPSQLDTAEQPSKTSPTELIAKPQVSTVHPDTMSNNPESYTAYAFTEKNGKLEKISVPWKDPEQGEIVVKVLACGVCGRFGRLSFR